MRSERRALDKIYKRRDRYDIPDWQRDKVWSDAQKRLLIDTILNGWKLPKFYFQKTNENPEEYDVVDGQQRLSSIWAFLDGELALSAESAAAFGGSYYDDLPDAVSDRFDDYEIEYDEITNATDEDVKEYFQRLQAGVALTGSEKLNSVHSSLRDYCARAAKDAFFAKTAVLSNKRYAYFDIIAKVAVIEIEGLDTGLRYKDVHKVFKSNHAFSPQSAAAKRINKTLKALRTIFPEGHKPFRNRTIVQSMITLICHLQSVGFNPEQKGLLRNFVDDFLAELSKQVELGQKATDPDYLEFQRTVNANVKSGARTRQTILLRKLFQKRPELFTTLSQSAGIATGIMADVTQRAKSLRTIIASVNERHAAQHGKDLFKPTNKTASTLAGLGNPVTTLDEYKAFIDGMYFVFRESVGQRLDGKIPNSFADVNDLRTMLQHDVDHGKGTKAAAKRKHLASIFSKYAGAPSADAVDPAAFPLIQANILAAVQTDLQILAKSLS